MMRWSSSGTFLALVCMEPTLGWSWIDRRSMLFSLSVACSAAPVAAAPVGAVPAPATAEDQLKIYFGAGCFWHVQHELFQEELGILQRNGIQISARTGYAGGSRLGPDGRICYHNREGVGDYGELGYAEAVEVTIPASALPAFSRRYFSLFGSRGYRHDPQDTGGEYRSVLGLPGGAKSPLFEAVREAAANSPMRLLVGEGDEPDTLGAKVVLVYDSNQFQFHPAEVYHQFHNDFASPPYGAAYNRLQLELLQAGRIGRTGCPERKRGGLY